MQTLVIQNSTICFKIGFPLTMSKIPLQQMSYELPSFIYNSQQRFMRGRYKMLVPYRATFLLYENGQVVILGFKNLQSISLLIEKFMNIIGQALININKKETELKLTVENINIKNIVYSGFLGHKIDLETFNNKITIKHIYEPINYPALYMFTNSENRKAFIALFRSGKFFISGEKSKKKIKKMFIVLLKEYNRVMN